MIQKTYEITSKEEAQKIVGNLQDITKDTTYHETIMQVFVFGFSYDEAWDILRPIQEAFPEFLINGMSLYMLKSPDVSDGKVLFDEEPALRLSFFFFDKAKVRMLCYDFDEISREDALADVRQAITSEKHLKGVCVTGAGMFYHISSFLEQLTEGFEDILFFGTMADVYYIAERQDVPYVFDQQRSFTHGVILLLYIGEELNLHMQYIFGWKPIGKPMPITYSEHPAEMGDVTIATIDSVAPEKVYNKYLGIHFNEYLTFNCCEFPLVIERDGLLIGRTPFTCTDKGEIVYIGTIRPEEKVRFSYTIRDDLISNTEKCSHEMYDFAPQAVELFMCGNRFIMFGKDAELELASFRRFSPAMVHCCAAGEIFYHHGKGGFLNSALIAVGFREGEAQETTRIDLSSKEICSRDDKVIPLSERVLTLMQAMSGDLVQYAKESRRASEAKSAFLASISHEIRTPINAVLGMDEMILREAKNEEILAYAKDIQAAGNTLLSLINDVLDFSKIEEGRMEILPTQYELSSVINDLVNMIRGRAEKKGLKLVVTVDHQIPYLLYGDEIRIKQIVMNLLTNAVKYTESGEVRIEINYSKSNENEIQLQFKISDTGIGMKEEDLEKLYTPFSRIEEIRNRSVEGTGLGMSIVQQLLTLMDSHLEVKSEYGGGSEFSFAITQQVVKWDPMGDYSARFEETATERAQDQELFHAPTAQVLVVDDNETNLTVICNLLKRTLIKLDAVSSGKEAVALTKEKTYDVVFIDHMMPEMDGIETLHRIKEQNPTAYTSYIVLTANAISGAREMYLDEGFSDYVSKPVRGRQIEEVLKNYLPSFKVLEPDVPIDVPEKVSAVDAVIEPERNPSAIPEWIRLIPMLDVEQGIGYCGTEESYLSVLEVFSETAKDKADEIEMLYQENDIKNYTIKVHALKSGARVVGALTLSEMAKELEAAGNAGDLDKIHRDTDTLLWKYRELDMALAQLSDKTEELQDVTPEMRAEVFRTINEIVESMDYEIMEQAMDDYKNYRFSPEDEEIIKKVEGRLMFLDWDGIREIMSTVQI